MTVMKKIMTATRYYRIHNPELLADFTFTTHLARYSYTNMTSGNIMTRQFTPKKGLDFLAFTKDRGELGVVMINQMEESVEYMDMSMLAAEQNFGSRIKDLYNRCVNFDEDSEDAFQNVAMGLGEGQWQ